MPKKKQQFKYNFQQPVIFTFKHFYKYVIAITVNKWASYARCVKGNNLRVLTRDKSGVRKIMLKI